MGDKSGKKFNVIPLPKYENTSTRNCDNSDTRTETFPNSSTLIDIPGCIPHNETSNEGNVNVPIICGYV